MVTRDSAPLGSPCWTDLWTSDVGGSRRFYSELFEWEAQEPSPEFGGYFMFTRDGVPIAGAMGDMGDVPPDDTWKIYLATGNVEKTIEMLGPAGAQLTIPPMVVADLGTQTALVDPTGAPLGVWQAASFPGFTVMNEPGAPSWFELHTRDFPGAVTFYRSVFGWETETTGDSDAFRYATIRDPSGEGELAGIMDAGGFLPEGAPAAWSVYWQVDDVDATVAKVESLGGAVVADAEDTPYGRLAAVADPAGAQFKLRAPDS